MPSHSPELFSDQFDNFAIADQHRPEQVFELLRAQEWIVKHVVYTDGVVDTEATSVEMGIPVHFNDRDVAEWHAYVAGLGDPDVPIEITISAIPHRLKDVNVNFGHELGHVFLQSKLGEYRPHYRDEEYFCDHFGRMTAIPEIEVDALETVDGSAIMMLSQRLGASHASVILRLMQRERLPPRVAYDVSFREWVKNPTYVGKLCRHVICLACETNMPHEATKDIMELPTIDLTSFIDIFSSSNDTPDHGDIYFNQANFEELQRRYQ